MTTQRDPDEILSAWLDEGPMRLPDQTRRAITVAIPMTSQRRRAISVPWRFRTMSATFKLALGAAALIAVVVVGAFFLGPSAPLGGVGTAPTPSPSPTASPPPPVPAPTPIVTIDWVPFMSDRYRYDIAYPPTWSSTPSTRDWSLKDDQRDWRSASTDSFRAPGNTLLFTVFAAPVPAGMSSDEWIATYFGPDANGSPNPCQSLQVDRGLIKVDGHPATFWREPETASCGGTYAFVPIGDRIFVFTVWRDGNEPLLEGYLAQVRFRLDAAAPGASPSLSSPAQATEPPIDTAAWRTYTSKEYGITIGHPADWGEEPAARAWTFEADAKDWLSPAADAFVTGVGAGIRVSAWSVALDPGTTVEGWSDVQAWVDTYCRKSDSTPCTGIHQRVVPLCNEKRDCHPGLLVPFDDDVLAFFTGGDFGDRMVVVAVWWGESAPAVAPYGGARRLLEGFLSTLGVWPAERTYPEQRNAAATFLTTGH